jgi:outer membrane beta-barrel protein
MRMACGALLLTMGTLGVASPAAAADEFDEGGTLYAIQKRKHVMGHEFTLAMGTIPMDAFYKGLTGTFQYTYHFNESWAWEIVSFTYSQDIYTSLKDDLEANWKVKPVNINEMTYFADSNLVWKPLYGKLVYHNRGLLFGEFFWVIGPAVAKYNSPGAYFGGNAGFGIRFYLSEHFSTRLDLRYYRFQRLEVSRLGDNDNVLFVQLGISLNVD